MTGVGRGIGGKVWPHLTQLVRPAKLKTLQDGQRTGLGLGGLHPPQYGLHDQHICCSRRQGITASPRSRESLHTFIQWAKQTSFLTKKRHGNIQKNLVPACASLLTVLHSPDELLSSAFELWSAVCKQFI